MEDYMDIQIERIDMSRQLHVCPADWDIKLLGDSDRGKTIRDVLATFDGDQMKVLYYLLGIALSGRIRML